MGLFEFNSSRKYIGFAGSTSNTRHPYIKFKTVIINEEEYIPVVSIYDLAISYRNKRDQGSSHSKPVINLTAIARERDLINAYCTNIPTLQQSIPSELHLLSGVGNTNGIIGPVTVENFVAGGQYFVNKIKQEISRDRTDLRYIPHYGYYDNLSTVLDLTLKLPYSVASRRSLESGVNFDYYKVNGLLGNLIGEDLRPIGCMMVNKKHVQYLRLCVSLDIHPNPSIFKFIIDPYYNSKDYPDKYFRRLFRNSLKTLREEKVEIVEIDNLTNVLLKTIKKPENTTSIMAHTNWLNSLLEEFSEEYPTLQTLEGNNIVITP